MNLDFSAVALVFAALGFYAQLITSYRRKMRDFQKIEAQNAARKKGKKIAAVKPTFGSFSNKHLDWAIGGAGYLLVMFGVAVNIKWISIPAIETVWWAPAAAGILLFSWFFH